MESVIENDVFYKKLKRIYHPKGDILHVLKSTDDSYQNFGEAYLTSINFREIKGWKKHNEMVMNLVVPCGNVRFFFFREQDNYARSIEIGVNNYIRLTVRPGIWVAFEGVSEELNLILNISSIPHDPNESVSADISKFPLANS